MKVTQLVRNFYVVSKSGLHWVNVQWIRREIWYLKRPFIMDDYCICHVEGELFQRKITSVAHLIATLNLAFWFHCLCQRLNTCCIVAIYVEAQLVYYYIAVQWHLQW